MPKIAVVAGSKSDDEIVQIACKYLQRFGIEYDSFVISAHRTPDKCREFAISARDNGYSLIIAIAGLAAHLPGVIASMTDLPVIGVPASGGAMNGIDALLSMVQMPGSTPVATVAIGKHGAINSAILAARILALNDSGVAEKLDIYRNELKQGKK